MLDDNAHSILDYLGEKAFGPAWIMLGMAEIASALTAAADSRYAAGIEGYIHHTMDLFFPALTAMAGVVSVYGRHRSKERHQQLEREKMHLKHELELLRIKSATPQKEADSGEDTFNLGPIS